MARKTVSKFIEHARVRHGDQYGYDNVVYHNNYTKVQIECSTHGPFLQTPSNHLLGRGCPKCAHAAQCLTHDEFLHSAHSVHGNRYDYTATVYVKSKLPISIICPDHGVFLQTPNDHLDGCGCPTCGVLGLRLTTVEWIARAVTVHGARYDYSAVDYTTTKTKIPISCYSHGIFWQKPNDHLSGYGCPTCANNTNRNDAETFIIASMKIHGNRYDYSNVRYLNNYTTVLIRCSDHGEFLQFPYNHYRGAGCPKCTHIISAPSQHWLDSIGIPDDREHREVRGLVIDKSYSVDGYDPDTKTVYEFHGDYWHGNPEVYGPADVNRTVGLTHGELYERTELRRQEFISAGYRYVEMWESEWTKLLQ